jgi:uncharacterized Zn-binding protein involved in type VI secretion
MSADNDFTLREGPNRSLAMINKPAFAIALSLIVLSATATGPLAQDRPAAPVQSAGPGVITEGAQGVTIGGSAAARAGDRTSDGDAVVKGSPNVFINGRPAVTVGDTTGCGGVVVGGASNVFINGKPVARAGDVTTGCAGK